MSETKDGGPAFPSEAVQTKAIGGSAREIPYFTLKGGMTRRDVFAGLAMNGILCAMSAAHRDIAKMDDPVAALAIVAVAQADALIARLEKP